MQRLFMIILLALVWCGFSANYSLANIFVAIIFAAIINLLIISLPSNNGYKINILHLLLLFVFVIYELVISSIEVAKDILTPHPRHSPAIIKIPISCKTDFGRMALGILITSTPGSVCLNLTPDGVMTVHAMFASDPEKIKLQITKKFEPMVKRAFEHA